MALLGLSIAGVANVDDILCLEWRSVEREWLLALVPVNGVAGDLEGDVVDAAQRSLASVGGDRPVEDGAGLFIRSVSYTLSMCTHCEQKNKKRGKMRSHNLMGDRREPAPNGMRMISR
jgi:hypothetical protein